MRTLGFALVLSFMGCGTPPLFDGIQHVETRTLQGGGLKQHSFTPLVQEEIAACLTNNTTALPSEDALTPPLLRHTILLEVTDKHGSKSFELLTKTDLKTQLKGEGHYFYNPCIHKIITRKPAPQPRRVRRRPSR